MEENHKLQINNVSEYAFKYPVWVIRIEKGTGKLWFYMAFNDPDRAMEAVKEIGNGCLAHREWCEAVGYINPD